MGCAASARTTGSHQKLWIGSGGTASALHYDAVNNLYAQVYGVKEVTLFSPQDSRYLYPQPTDSRAFYYSSVDVGCPDLTRFPLYSKAKPATIVLEPGQMLFLPAFWWHYVKAVSTSISTNLWYAPYTEQFASENALLKLRHAVRANQYAEFRRFLGGVAEKDLQSGRRSTQTFHEVDVLYAAAVVGECKRREGSDQPELKACAEELAEVLTRCAAGLVPHPVDTHRLLNRAYAVALRSGLWDKECGG